MRQVKGRFVEKLDYLTSPGYLDGSDGRQKAGLRPGGPELVITDKAVFRFDEETKRMYLAGCYAGVDMDEILETVDFSLDCRRAAPVPEATGKELLILREKCDPQGLIR
jgi:glutaconate CoA-transferase subunit B